VAICALLSYQCLSNTAYDLFAETCNLIAVLGLLQITTAVERIPLVLRLIQSVIKVERYHFWKCVVMVCMMAVNTTDRGGPGRGRGVSVL
jgi:hypothetical protein